MRAKARNNAKIDVTTLSKNELKAYIDMQSRQSLKDFADNLVVGEVYTKMSDIYAKKTDDFLSDKSIKAYMAKDCTFREVTDKVVRKSRKRKVRTYVNVENPNDTIIRKSIVTEYTIEKR